MPQQPQSQVLVKLNHKAPAWLSCAGVTLSALYALHETSRCQGYTCAIGDLNDRYVVSHVAVDAHGGQAQEGVGRWL